MIYFVLFILEIIIIFFLSRSVQRSLSYILHDIFKNKQASVIILSILFLPGTFVHEIAHFLFALFLLVPVGEMHLIPVIEEDSIRLGSVAIARTDPIRRFFIGAAPLILGILILTVSFYFLSFKDLFENWALSLVVLYLTFTVSNSMFSSKKDMEGMWVFIAIVLIFALLLYFLGVSIDLSVFFERFSGVFKNASVFMAVPLAIDIIFLSLAPRSK